jgi:outer membrane lipoprotein carrier protein
MKRLLYIAGLGLCLLAAISSASDNAADQLLAELSGLSHLQGDFSQRQLGEGGEVLAESSGRFRLLRPGYFAWEILSPDSQLIIADPQNLWHYDRDLETVTRRPVAGRAEMSPLQVLGGDENLLRERFTVTVAEDGAFQLLPVAGDQGFRRLTLYLDGGSIQGMDILDSLGQRVTIEFRNLDAATALTAEDFAFTPPAGADLFYHDE